MTRLTDKHFLPDRNIDTLEDPDMHDDMRELKRAKESQDYENEVSLSTSRTTSFATTENDKNVRFSDSKAEKNIEDDKKRRKRGKKSKKSHHDEYSDIDFNEERIFFSQFRILMKMRRPDISERRIRILYNAMCQVQDRDLAVSSMDDSGIGITRNQWQNFYQYVNIEIFRDPKYAVETLLDINQEDLLFAEVINEDDMLYQDCCMQMCHYCIKSNNVPKLTPGGGGNSSIDNDKFTKSSPVGKKTDSNSAKHQKMDHLDPMKWRTTKKRTCMVQCRNIWIKIWLGIRSILYRIFTHRILSALIDLLVWVGTIIVIMEISYSEELELISDILVYLFVVEVTLRWIAFGKYYVKDTFNVLDFTVVYISLGLDLFIDNDTESHQTAQANVLVAFRLLRFLRALATIERFKLIISTSITVLSNLCILFSLEFCVFYIFAVIGLMVCFFLFLFVCLFFVLCLIFALFGYCIYPCTRNKEFLQWQKHSCV